MAMADGGDVMAMADGDDVKAATTMKTLAIPGERGRWKMTASQ